MMMSRIIKALILLLLFSSKLLIEKPRSVLNPIAKSQREIVFHCHFNLTNSLYILFAFSALGPNWVYFYTTLFLVGQDADKSN